MDFLEAVHASDLVINKKWKKLQEGEKTSETMAVSAGRELQESDFHFYVEEEKWNIRNKQVDWNLKFEIKVGPKTFETGENSWLRAFTSARLNFLSILNEKTVKAWIKALLRTRKRRQM